MHQLDGILSKLMVTHQASKSVVFNAFSALTLLVGCYEENPACKN